MLLILLTNSYLMCFKRNWQYVQQKVREKITLKIVTYEASLKEWKYLSFTSYEVQVMIML